MGLLVVGERSGTRLSFDRLVNRWLSSLYLLFWYGQHVVALEFHLLLLFGVLHFHDKALVLFEVNSVKGDKGRNPNAESSPKLPVLKVVLEDRVAGIFHQVQVLQIRAGCGYFVEGLRFTCQLIV